MAIEWDRRREMVGKRLHAVNQVHGNHPIPATHVRRAKEVDNFAGWVALHALVEPPTANTGVRHHSKHTNCQFWRSNSKTSKVDFKFGAHSGLPCQGDHCLVMCVQLDLARAIKQNIPEQQNENIQRV